jgi:hypothetical protein
VGDGKYSVEATTRALGADTASPTSSVTYDVGPQSALRMQATTVYSHEYAALAAWSTMALSLAVFPVTLDFTTDPVVDVARRLASTSDPAAPAVAVLFCANA